MTRRPQLRRSVETVSTSSAVSAVLGMVLGRIRRAIIPSQSDMIRAVCPAAVIVLFILSLVLPPNLISGGTHDVKLLYSSVGLFYTVLFMTMSLSDCTGRPDVGCMYFAPWTPFMLLLVRIFYELVPIIIGSFMMLIFSFGIVSALFDVGALFFVLYLIGFAVTVILGVLMLTALRALEVIFGFRQSAVRLVFAVLLVLWIALAVVLTPYTGSVGRFCAALVSPVGTTVPVGGWLCAVIMGICEGSVWTAVPGALLCPAFGAVLVMMLCVMNESQYDLAISALLDGERRSAFTERAVNLSVRISSGISARLAEIASGAKSSELTTLSLFKAELCRIISGRGHGIYRRLVISVNSVLLCTITAAVYGSEFGAEFVITALASLFVLLRIMTVDLYYGGSAVSSALLALYEVIGCVAAAVFSIVPAAIITGVSVGFTALAVLLAVIISTAAVFGCRMLSHRASVFSAAALIAVCIMAAL